MDAGGKAKRKVGFRWWELKQIFGPTCMTAEQTILKNMHQGSMKVSNNADACGGMFLFVRWERY